MAGRVIRSRAVERKKFLQLLQVGKTQLGWDETFYRGIFLPQCGAVKDDKGRYSASSLSDGQLIAAVERLRGFGFVPKAKAVNGNVDGSPASARPLADDAQSRKIRALWLELHKLGKVRNPSEASLGAYVLRQTGVEALQWLSTGQAARVIEALKAWLRRK